MRRENREREKDPRIRGRQKVDVVASFQTHERRRDPRDVSLSHTRTQGLPLSFGFDFNFFFSGSYRSLNHRICTICPQLFSLLHCFTDFLTQRDPTLRDSWLLLYSFPFAGIRSSLHRQPFFLFLQQQLFQRSNLSPAFGDAHTQTVFLSLNTRATARFHSRSSHEKCECTMLLR